MQSRKIHCYYSPIVFFLLFYSNILTISRKLLYNIGNILSFGRVFMIFHQPHNSLSNYTYNAFFYTSEVWNFHFHKNLELIYVIKGTLKCTINRNEYILKPGDCV